MPRRLLVSALTLLPTLALAEPPSPKVLERYQQMLQANPAEGTALDRLWQAYSEQGKTGALLAEYEKQSTYASQMILGLLLQKAGRSQDAAAAFQRALTLDDKNPAPALALGRIESAGGHPSQAAIWYRKAVELIPDSDSRKMDALLQLGAVCLASGELDQAADAWEKTIALAPQDLALRRQLAETYARNHLAARALPHLQFIEQHGQPQERAQALQQIAGIHQASGAQDDAIRALEKAIGYTAPGNWLRSELLAQLIRLHQRYHRVPELEAKWKKYAEENPRDLGAYLQLIDLYERLGDHSQQLAWLEKLILSTPRTVEYRLRRARLLAEMDDLEAAAKAYDELLGTEPRNVDLVFERARLDVQRDQPKAAGERISQLLTRLGNDEAIRARALEFYQTNRLYDLAEQHLVEDARAGSPDQLQALANFYFSRDRSSDARKVLTRLVHADAPPGQQADAWFRIAGVLREQNEVAQAIEAVRKAIGLRDNAREYHFLLGELESANARYVAAETAFEKAFALSKTPTEALEADQRLYDSLRSQKEAGEDDQRGNPPRPDSAASVTSRAAQAYLLNLIRAAVEETTEERWLRVAQWQNWSRNFRGAVDAAERALTLNPQSLAAHDFLARLYAADPQGPGAQQHLRELMKIDAPNRIAYLRRLGQVELQNGRTEESLKIFQQIVDETPGDLDALNDLALAQQRAEQWNEALATLQKIHSLSPVSRKKDAVASLLRVYDRLAMRQPAAELLLAQTDAETEVKDRFVTFGDLLAICTRYGLLEWLRDQFGQRHKLRVDDYFTEVAYGRVLKAQGNKAAAFEVLADAAYASPNPAEALPELVREAEELHRMDAAIQLQEQLVRVVPQIAPEALERLADLQEKALRPKDAAQTWAKLVTRFPRDIVVLGRAVDFERTWGTSERALALLRRIRAIEPENVQTLASLADLALKEGRSAEAEEVLEALLAHAPAEPAGEPVKYPAVRPDDPSRLEIAYRSTVKRRNGKPSPEAIKGLRAFWVEKPDQLHGSGQRTARLEAIRQLGELIKAKADPAARQRWTERWRKPGVSTTEKLWALYYGGASSALLDELTQLMSAKQEDSAAINAFIWLALQTGEFDRLAAWHRDPRRTPAERDYLTVAFAQYADDHDGPMPPVLIQKLFPDGYRMRVWQASTDLAQHGFYREAIQLRERVFQGLTTQRPACGYELAQWHILLGQVDDARRVLRGSLGVSGDNFGSPIYAVIRALYLLTPEPERPALEHEIAASLDAKSSPVHAALTRALLAGLAGRKAEAIEFLGQLLDQRVISLAATDDRATAGTRRWDFVLSTGGALQTWHLEDLALAFWERALSDEAGISLQVQGLAPESESVRARVLEVRTRVTALKLMYAASFEREDLLKEYSRYSPPDGLIPLAEMLESVGANPVAIDVYRRAWEREPANPHALRNALSACRNGNNWEVLEEILSRVVNEGHFRQNDAAQRDLVVQLADALERRKEYDRAAGLIDDLMKTAPHESRLSLKLARLYELGGHIAAAETAYRQMLSVEPASVAARLAFATLLDGTGRTTSAIDVLERAAGGEIDARLAELNFKAGRVDEGLAALERVPPGEQARATLALVDLLEKQGDTLKARLLLRGGLGRAKDEAGSFALQTKLIQLLPAETDRAVVRAEIRRLGQFAIGEGIDTADLLKVVAKESQRLGLEREYREDLVKTWAGGQGDLGSGLALLNWQVEHGEKPAATATWSEMKKSTALTGGIAGQVAEALGRVGDHTSEAEALGRAARLEAQEYRSLLPWLRALDSLGQTLEAHSVAEELAARSVFNAEMVPAAAEAFSILGETPGARALYTRAVDYDPTAHVPATHFALAHLFLGLGEYGATRQILRNTALNSAAEVVPPIIEYLKQSGRMEQGDDLPDFELSASNRVALNRAIFAEHLQASHLPKALELAEKSPEILDAPTHEKLRAAVKAAGAFAQVVPWMERRLLQHGEERSQLALVLGDWAEAELVSLQVDSAVGHLQRAYDLQPGNWPVVERLAELRLQRGEPKLAAKVLNAFLSVATDSAEKEKARQMLARIPSA